MKRIHPNSSLIHQLSLTLIAMCSTNAMCEPQDVHMNSFLIQNNGVIHLINNTPNPIPLDGWRFLTTNASGTAMQSAPHALDGLVVPPTLSLSIPIDHNDSLGPFADRHSEAFVVSLFFPDSEGEISFDDPTQIADHLQWSTHGIHHPIANAHNQLAVDAGLWTAHNEWIDAPENVYMVHVSEDPTNVLHGPENYFVIPGSCRADINHDGNINFFDVSAFLNAFSTQHFEADMNNDNEWNFFDVSLFLNLYSAGGGCD